MAGEFLVVVGANLFMFRFWWEERGREYPLSFSSLFPSEPPVRAAQFESLNSFLGFRKHWDSQWERGCVQCDLPICFCLLELCFLLWFLLREECSCLLWQLVCNGLKCLGRLFPLVGSLIRWSDNQARICSYLSLILSRTSVLFVAFLNMELLLVRLWHRKAWNIQTVCCGTWLVGQLGGNIEVFIRHRYGFWSQLSGSFLRQRFFRHKMPVLIYWHACWCTD